MEGLALLAIVFLVGIPTISLVALVRTGRLRKLLDEQYSEHLRDASALKQEIDALHSALMRVSKQVDERPGATADARSAEIPAAKLVPLATVTEKPAPIPSPPTAEAVRVIVVPPPTLHPLIAPQPVAPPRPVAPLVTPAVMSETSEPQQAAHVSTVPPAPIAPKTPEPQVEAIPTAYRPVAVPVPPRPVEQPPRVTVRTTVANYAPFKSAAPPRKSLAERLRATLPLEEVLGMNLFAKFGIILLVTGFALLGRVALVAIGAGGRVALLYAAAATLLGGGIWLERKERYRLVGRTGIGGGWALLFFTTYAMHHVAAMQVMSSEVLNCALLLGVAIAMVAHTLRYQRCTQAKDGQSWSRGRCSDQALGSTQACRQAHSDQRSGL
jgi:hypothetical protein